jgi:hypothetical protein
MKAWYLDIQEDPDQGAYIVFANTRNEARKQADSNDLMYDSWLDIHAVRARQYDGMEKAKDSELALKQWQSGWRWFDLYDMPDEGEATDAEFLKWWHKNFDKTCDVCGKVDEEVRHIFCGFQNQIHGRYVRETICTPCEREHLDQV